VQKAVQEMRDKNAAGYDDVLGDVLKLLGRVNWRVAQRFY
jgi:hypothetical protein